MEPVNAQLPLSNEDRNRRRRKIILFVLGITVIAFGSFSNYGLVTRLRLEQHRSSLVDSLRLMQQRRDSLRLRSELLRKDTLEIERLAREKYGMAKPGEQVFIIRDESAK